MVIHTTMRSAKCLNHHKEFAYKHRQKNCTGHKHKSTTGSIEKNFSAHQLDVMVCIMMYAKTPRKQAYRDEMKTWPGK